MDENADFTCKILQASDLKNKNMVDCPNLWPVYGYS
jgi:hypothetical protein